MKYFPENAFSASLKIIVPLYVTYILFFLSVFAVFLPMTEKQMMDRKKEMIQGLTESTASLLSGYHQRVEKGELALDDAQQRAISRIRHLRYGINGKDYFWIVDMQHRVIMHPYVPELEGVDQTGLADATGKHMFVEFVRTAEKGGQGFVEYLWQWNDVPGLAVPKISYVREFSPWGWVLGTGLYLDDINREINVITQGFVKLFLGVLLAVILMSFYITWQTVKVEKRRQQAEDRLRQSEARYRLLADNATDVIWILHLSDFVFSYISPSVEQILGYPPEALTGMKMDKIITPDSMEKAMALIREELEYEIDATGGNRHYRVIELELVRKDGKTIWTETTACFLKNAEGKPDRVLGNTRDITGRINLEKRLRQAQKMEALGTLAGGIAHDFNNILSSVLGFAELVKMDIPEDEQTRNNIDQILAAGVRARDLVGHILTFSRQADVQKHLLQIEPLIRESIKFIKASAPAAIEIRHELAGSSGLVEADPTQIHQILMNLFTNALHAMKDSGGILDIRVKSVELSDGEMLQGRDLKPGHYIPRRPDGRVLRSVTNSR